MLVLVAYLYDHAGILSEEGLDDVRLFTFRRDVSQ